MKRIWLLMIAAIAAVAVVSGATMALFTASAAQATSKITAGTLAIKGDRDQGDTIPGPMFYTTKAEGETAPGANNGQLPTLHWAPGDTHHRVLQVENTGSLSALLKQISAANEGDPSTLPDVLDVKVTTDPAGSNVIASGKLVEFFAGKAIAPILADPGDVIDLHFWVTMPLSTGNAYQGANLKAQFSVYAEQAKNNP